MSNFSAIIPVANLAAANTTLEQAGYGPNNFSVAAYANAGPTHAVLHSWHDAAFQAAVEAIPGAVVNTTNTDPITVTHSACASQSAAWGDRALPLPDTGNVAAGTLWTWGGKRWWAVQMFNRSTYGGDPALLPPAIIRYARVPGKREAWVQPIDQYDAYKTVNPFTGLPDECVHAGKNWRVSQGDGSGNNVFEPGVFGWTEVTP